MKKVKSAKGAFVDFDLIKIKQEMISAPTPLDVRKRQDFIESRMRRRARKVTAPIPKAVESTETPTGIPPMDDVPVPVVDIVDSTVDVVDNTIETETTTKQRARPKTKTKEEDQ
jgi:hypothetical protein